MVRLAVDVQDYDTDPKKLNLILAKDGAKLELPGVRITATFALIRDHNGLLLCVHNERGWDIPGGHVEAGETVQQATIREVMEEACVSVNELAFYALILNNNTAMAVFTAQLAEIHTFKPHIDDTILDRTFVSVDEFMSVYGGGDKQLMHALLEHLPPQSK